MATRSLMRTLFAALATTAVVAAQWGPKSTTGSPTARSGAMMAFDVLQNRMLLFGGNWGNELWSFANGSWTQLTPSIAPGPRARSAMAANPLSGEIVLYGGIDGSGVQTPFAADDTWAWDGTNWQQRTPMHTPGGRARHMMVYDLARQVTVLFGGRYNLYQPTQALADTWEYDGIDWHHIVPVNSPPGLTDAAMAYLAAQGKTVLFGGEDHSGVPRDETWTYDGADWQLIPITGPKPSARTGARMEQILGRGVVMLTGGRDPITQVIQNDSWEFDGTAWRQLHAVYGGMYPPRSDFAMAHDFLTDRITAFGGVTQTNMVLDDTQQFGAQFQPFGAGCAGTGGTPRLVLGALPVLGTQLRVDLIDLPPASTLAAMSLGLSRTQWVLGNLPMLLTNLGMPGCRAYASADVLVTLPVVGGVASWTFDLPQLPFLLGDAYHLQGIAVDPGVNGAGLTVSNAATIVLGY